MKSGRKRRDNVPRQPGGRIAYDRIEREAPPVAAIRFYSEAARKAKPIFAGPLGRLHFLGEFSAKDVAAADYYCRVRARYDAVKGIPRRTAASPAYGAYVAGGGAEPDNKSIERAIRQWEALRDEMQQPAVNLLDRVIVCLEEPSWNERLILISVFDRLARFAGLKA